MAFRSKIWLLLLAASAVLLACSKPDDKFVGVYTGENKLAEDKAKSPTPPDATVKSHRMLTLNKDKSAIYTSEAGKSWNGTWSLKNDVILVTEGSSRQGEPIRLDASGDGKELKSSNGWTYTKN